MALSLAMIWGKAGILSFGQTAFFGIGGYLYGIYTLNVLGSGATWIGILVGVLAGAIVAAFSVTSCSMAGSTTCSSG